MSNLTERLIGIQRDLKAPKGQFNNFGKYNYRSAEDILEAVKPLNASQGLLLTLTDKPILVGEWNYIEATATLSDGENSLHVTAYARESENKKGMDHSQITGTASSYARKYALNGLYLIDDTKDADTDEYRSNQQNGQSNQVNQPNPNAITGEQIGQLKTKALQMAKLHNITVEQVYQKIKVSSVEGLTTQQAATHIKNLNSWLGGK